VNKIPSSFVEWHGGALDHTPNDVDGYMYFVNVGEIGSQLFNSTVNDLDTGLRYEFSAYLTNIRKKGNDSKKPNIRFEVRTVTDQNDLLANLSTGDIPEYDNMTWSKYGLSFIALNSSAILLMISNVGKGKGNDLAIDDIELRVCSTLYSSVDPPS
jgi:hypothetical protein